MNVLKRILINRMIADGMCADVILKAFPDLAREEVQEALRYAAETVREREK